MHYYLLQPLKHKRANSMDMNHRDDGYLKHKDPRLYRRQSTTVEIQTPCFKCLRSALHCYNIVVLVSFWNLYWRQLHLRQYSGVQSWLWSQFESELYLLILHVKNVTSACFPLQTMYFSYDINVIILNMHVHKKKMVPQVFRTNPYIWIQIL